MNEWLFGDPTSEAVPARFEEHKVGSLNYNYLFPHTFESVISCG